MKTNLNGVFRPVGRRLGCGDVFRRGFIFGALAFLLTATVPSFGAVDLADGLTGFWKLDESAGSTAFDSSGRNINGALAGNPVWSAGKQNNALWLDGNGDYVDLGSDSFGLSTALSVVFWVYPQSNSSGVKTIIGRHQFIRPFSVRWDADAQTIQTVLRTQSGTTYLSAGAPLALNQWHHVVLTYRSGTRVIYINGVESASDSPSGDLSVTDARTYMGSIDTVNGFFKGALDEVRIYNRDLSVDEVGALHGNTEPPPPSSGVYYVDFVTGSNTNRGVSPDAPWKHAPGDPNATNVPRSVTLQPGDTIFFKGGVVYRGGFEMKFSGSPDKPIVYDGSSWGSGRAIIDGSNPFTQTWTRCASAADAGNNPNWNEIFVATAPANHNFRIPIFENGVLLNIAQDPNPPDPFFYEDTGDFRTLSISDPFTRITRTSITDPYFFNQSSDNYWDGAYIQVWRQPNVVSMVRILSFNPANYTVTFEDMGGEPYTDRDSRYAVMNHRSLIDRPGEFCVYNGRVYAWLRQPGSPVEVGARKRGINVTGQSHIVVRGFHVQKFYGDVKDFYMGVGILCRSTSGISSFVTIRDNIVENIIAAEKSGAVYLDNKAENIFFEDNIVRENQNRGVLVYSNLARLRRNTIERVTGTGILMMSSANGQITHNRLDKLTGSHANGISVYMYCADILVAGNYVANSLMPLTIRETNNIYIFNNVFDSTGYDTTISLWTEVTGHLYIINNTLIQNSRNFALNGAEGSGVVINNIVDGGNGKTRLHNIYTGLAWNQTPKYDWSLSTGEFLSEDLGSLLVGVTTGDYRLLPNSPAVDAGIDAAEYLPRLKFPDFDFTVDRDGTRRPQGTTWDIGAHEFDSLETSVPSQAWQIYR
jgi:hypothetical protein